MANRAVPNARAMANSTSSAGNQRLNHGEERIQDTEFVVEFSTPSSDRKFRFSSLHTPNHTHASETESHNVGNENAPLLRFQTEAISGRRNQATSADSRRILTMECSCALGSAWNNQFADDPEFATVVRKAEHAILCGGRQPERIYQGSSGSYFVRDIHGNRIGVFKPKDEEPYGHLNPKFMKWMHKVCCPCCFGRSCLVPNKGYLSEAGAYLVDLHLQLQVVPPTRIVRLASESFNYDPIARKKVRIKQQLANRFPELRKHIHRLALPSKIGSFQLFVEDHRDADEWLRKFDADPHLLTDTARHQFLVQFQRLVILDYIIRNTDRGNDNWLIRYDLPTERKTNNSNRAGATIGRSRSTDSLSTLGASPTRKRSSQEPMSSGQIRSVAKSQSNLAANSSGNGTKVGSSKAADAGVSGRPVKSKRNFANDSLEKSDGDINSSLEFVGRARIHVAAIDNGLAFPFKHPDEVRSYPFGWSWLAIAKEPFLNEVCDLVLPRLESPNMSLLYDRLRSLFRVDRSFDASTFEKQLDVVRGQVLNLRRALKERYSPAQLVTMPPVLVRTDGTNAQQLFVKETACFSCC